jgi:hypothetical protein
MNIIPRIIGFALMILSLYFLGQNITFTSRIGLYWWVDISAAASVLSLMAGVLCILFGGRNFSQLGWILVGFAIILVFLCSKVILQPTSLWNFFLAMLSMLTGWNLMRTGRIGL